MLPPNPPRIPLERIKRNYDEASYRQIEMEIDNLAEARLAKTDGHTRATYHVERGKELLAQNMATQAESEFRAAVSSDHSNAAAHAQLAIVLEKKGDVANARSEAQTSVRLQPNVDALLVLARLDLKQSQLAIGRQRSGPCSGLAARRCDRAGPEARDRREADSFKVA